MRLLTWSLSLFLALFLSFSCAFSFSQDPLSGGHSSGSSTSSLSTPPSAAHSPPQQQVNGVGMAGVGVQPGNANSSLPAIAGVTGLMGALQGNHLTMSGIVGALNGVIQSSPSLTQNTSSLTTHPSITSASLPNSLNNRYRHGLHCSFYIGIGKLSLFIVFAYFLHNSVYTQYISCKNRYLLFDKSNNFIIFYKKQFSLTMQKI